MALYLYCITVGFSLFQMMPHYCLNPPNIQLPRERPWWLTLMFQARFISLGLHSQNDCHLWTSLHFPRFTLFCSPSIFSSWISLMCLLLSSPGIAVTSHNTNGSLSPELTAHLSQSLQLLGTIKFTPLLRFSTCLYCIFSLNKYLLLYCLPTAL